MDSLAIYSKLKLLLKNMKLMRILKKWMTFKIGPLLLV